MKTSVRTLSFIAAAAMVTAALNACGRKDDEFREADASQYAGEMKAIAEQYVPNVIYATYGDLAKETEELYNLLNSATEKGVSALTDSDLQAICAKFLQARQSWEESEAFLYGAATTFGIDPHIDTWPLDLDALATSLSNAEQVEQLKGEDGILYAGGKLGKELLGFHGIEFILFRDGQERKASALQDRETDEAFSGKNVTGEQELIYATAVAGDLRDNCYQLCVSWNPDAPDKYAERCEEVEAETAMPGSDITFGENMLKATQRGSTYATWQNVMSAILIAGCSNICDEVANTKMGNAHSGEDINYIESPYSKKSFQDFKDNILSIRYSLYGKAGAASPETHSLMTFFRSNYSGASAIETALERSLAALDACMAKGAFVDIYSDASVQTAMDEINALNYELVKADAWIVRQ